MAKQPGSDATRRRFVTGLGTLAGVALAGCAGSADDSDGTTTGGGSVDTSTEAESVETTTAGGSSGSYAVSMEPVGEVSFEQVPETWATYCPGYADMGVALGVGDGLQSVGIKSRYYTRYYDELDGVGVDKAAITQLYDSGIDKEVFYDMSADVHVIDPNWLVHNFKGWEQKDVDEITEGVAPFLGNTIFRRTDDWHDYRYYTMYEAFETVARLFRREDRYEAFASLHDEYVGRLESKLPPEGDRPDGLLCFAASDEPEQFSPYRIDGEGTNKKQFHDLGIGDALAGSAVEGLSSSNRAKIDYEQMLEVDPDALFVRGHETKTRTEFEDTVLAFMEEHSVASELTAVQKGAVYRGGPIYQGPVQNLFLTERFATLVYPDVYSGELFDRAAVSNVVAGDA